MVYMFNKKGILGAGQDRKNALEGLKTQHFCTARGGTPILDC